jgi:hypothetical protein
VTIFLKLHTFRLWYAIIFLGFDLFCMKTIHVSDLPPGQQRIIMDTKSIAKFLTWNSVSYDSVWIPQKSDLAIIDSALQIFLTDSIKNSYDSISYRKISFVIEKYNKEISGFYSGTEKCIIVQMVLWGHDESKTGLDNFSIICDGGFDVVYFVYSTISQKILFMGWNGNA